MDRGNAGSEIPLGLAPQSALAHRSTDVLKRLVEQHIVPRLVVSHPCRLRSRTSSRQIAERVADMTELALQSDDEHARELLSDLSARGASHDSLQLGLIAPAAERLGRLWRHDQIGFLEVSIATNSLIRSMRFVSLELDRLPRAGSGRSAILVAPSPGESHIFGAAMAAEFFRRGGWHVAFVASPTHDDLVGEVASQHLDVVGLSLSSDLALAQLTRTIAAMRKSSLNPNLVVIVGGPMFVSDPALVSAVGADAAIAAVELASAETRRLVSRLGKLR